MATDNTDQATMDVELNVTNESNDTNNSKIVIFGEGQALGDALAGQAGRAVKLNFVNRSNDTNNSDVVIFAKSGATDVDELAVAWTVIQNCGQGWNHPFDYALNVAVGAIDSYGNSAPQMPAASGQAFAVVKTASGETLRSIGPASAPSEIDVENDLQMGAINALVYRDGKLFAQKTGVAPGQKAVFAFKPTIWIGVVSQIQQGEVMNAAIISQINTELSLLGVASADIVMTGGGSGPTATPFMFSLENVTYA